MPEIIPTHPDGRPKSPAEIESESLAIRQRELREQIYLENQRLADEAKAEAAMARVREEAEAYRQRQQQEEIARKFAERKQREDEARSKEEREKQIREQALQAEIAKREAAAAKARAEAAELERLAQETRALEIERQRLAAEADRRKALREQTENLAQKMRDASVEELSEEILVAQQELLKAKDHLQVCINAENIARAEYDTWKDKNRMPSNNDANAWDAKLRELSRLSFLAEVEVRKLIDKTEKKYTFTPVPNDGLDRQVGGLDEQAGGLEAAEPDSWGTPALRRLLRRNS